MINYLKEEENAVCADGVMVIASEWEIVKPSSNSDQVHYSHSCTNTGKVGIHLFSPKLSVK